MARKRKPKVTLLAEALGTFELYRVEYPDGTTRLRIEFDLEDAAIGKVGFKAGNPQPRGAAKPRKSSR